MNVPIKRQCSHVNSITTRTKFCISVTSLSTFANKYFWLPNVIQCAPLAFGWRFNGRLFNKLPVTIKFVVFIKVNVLSCN